MKVKTSELTDLALSWLLVHLEFPDAHMSVVLNEGKAEIWDDSDIGTGRPTFDREGKPRFIRASDGAFVSLFGCPIEFLNWEQCGPIIEREHITVDWLAREWSATIVELKGVALMPQGYSYGPTPLIAAMRAFVASKLGNEVDVPEELA